MKKTVFIVLAVFLIAVVGEFAAAESVTTLTCDFCNIEFAEDCDHVRRFYTVTETWRNCDGHGGDGMLLSCAMYFGMPAPNRHFCSITQLTAYYTPEEPEEIVGITTDPGEGTFEAVSEAEFNTLRARITKLEAELRRTAAFVYTIHGGGEWEKPQQFIIVDEAGNESIMSSFPSRYIPTCEMDVSALFEQRIDECLANVTIEEESE